MSLLHQNIVSFLFSPNLGECKFNLLRPSDTYTSVNWINIDSGNVCSIVCSAPSHCLNQLWLIKQWDPWQQTYVNCWSKYNKPFWKKQLWIWRLQNAGHLFRHPRVQHEHSALRHLSCTGPLQLSYITIKLGYSEHALCVKYMYNWYQYRSGIKIHDLYHQNANFTERLRMIIRSRTVKLAFCLLLPKPACEEIKLAPDQMQYMGSARIWRQYWHRWQEQLGKETKWQYSGIVWVLCFG